jgi:hypothetical protein
LAADGGFTLTASAESADADTPTVVSKTVSDVAGNSTTRSVSALIDKTAPTISASLSPDANANGWNNSDVTVEFTCSDALSGLSGTCPDDVVLGEGANQSVTKSVTDQAGNTASVTKSGINIDKTAPTIGATLTPANPAASGWYNISTGAPKASYTCNDLLSGVDGTCPGVFTFGEGNNLSHSETISDKAGNEATAAVNNIKVDLTKPSVSVTGVSNGATYTTGNVPTPGCDTQDQEGLSGVKTNATVNVTGGTGGFGTLTATCSGAEDNAGNTNSASVTYGVSAAFNGFLQPIDGHSVNTGKFGRTYPIKWQLRDSSGALISDTTAQLLVGMMTGGQKSVSCTSFTLEPEDALEESTTGNTALRYDATSDQFIYNYKAPTSGTCYVFAIRNADGVTTQQVDFKFTK